MATNLEHPRPGASSSHYPIYPEDICPRMQSLLAVLADIDCAHEKNLDSIRHSTADESQKRELLNLLRKRHQERRAPYIRELEALQQRIDAIFK
jgi:hypothetical protein